LNSSLRVTLVQLSPVWEDRAASRDKIADMVQTAEPKTDWLVFPEMALTGFSMDLGKTTWKPDDYAFFSDLSRSFHCYCTVGGVEEGRNTAMVFRPDGTLIARYVKRQLFSFAGEDRHYQKGATPTRYAVGSVNISQGICYDLRFPGNFWPEAPVVDAYCVIAAWGGKRREHWRSLLAARAIENQAFCIGVNRTGQEPGNFYTGDSMVIDPMGRVLLDCGEEEGVFTVALDLGAVKDWRATFPALADRES